MMRRFQVRLSRATSSALALHCSTFAFFLQRTASKKATDAGEPKTTSQPLSASPRRILRLSKPPSASPSQPLPMSYSSGASIGDSTSTSKDHWYNSNNTLSSGGFGGGGGSRGSAASLASLRESLPESPTVYDISEIRSATNNFLARRHSASSSAPCWRCSLRGKDAIVLQRKFHRVTSPAAVRDNLSVICKSHHVTIINLLGASLSGGDIFLIYEFVPGVNLSDCLRNPNNPSFTMLSTWMSRIKIATDLANGLDYIHNNTGLRLVHNHIKSGSVIVAEPTLNARICHFGTAILCGEAVEEEHIQIETEIMKLKRSNSEMFQGTRGYMSPEFQSTGIGTQRSDVYALGVVMLELVSGEEALKYTYDKGTQEYVRRSVVEGAREAVEEEGRLRRWVDRRLRDSFPVGVAEKLTKLALDCVEVEADQRPNMRRVAAKISQLYLQSQGWADRIQPPPDLTLSYGPR